MAKIAQKTLSWGASSDADVIGYRLRWAIPPALIDYTTPSFDVGKVTQVALPVTGMPLIDGQLTMGLTAVDDVGNESDIATLTAPFDLVAPAPPTGLMIV